MSSTKFIQVHSIHALAHRYEHGRVPRRRGVASDQAQVVLHLTCAVQPPIHDRSCPNPGAHQSIAQRSGLPMTIRFRV
jgi:hypothetical protein